MPLFAEIVAWLNDRDWVAYDICGLTRRPLDKALWQADLIFVPRNSPLRTDNRTSIWANFPPSWQAWIGNLWRFL